MKLKRACAAIGVERALIAAVTHLVRARARVRVRVRVGVRGWVRVRDWGRVTGRGRGTSASTH